MKQTNVKTKVFINTEYYKMDTIIDIPQNIILRTKDNMIFKIDEDLCKTNSYFKNFNGNNENQIDINSNLLSKIVKVLANPVVDEWDSDYDLISKKYNIAITPSIYCWLGNSKLYTDFDYQHHCKITSVLCNEKFIVFHDILGNLFFCNTFEKYVYNTGIVSKYSPNFALHPSLPLLALSDDTRKNIIVFNLDTRRKVVINLNYVVASSIVYSSIDWQNGNLFVKSLYFQKYNCYRFENNKLIEIDTQKYEYNSLVNTNRIKIEKEHDGLIVYKKNFKNYKLMDVGEKCKFDYNDKIFVYTNYNQLTIFILNK